ncbi:methylmalonyl-CoA epimerase [Halobellus ruber]|uniref:Methylmalonyl-CoA epimerase n=1 Tax=Halobellus ruber TaxID=2761102 RepID=A0A7J9SIX0_9EURY|nr:methylmalonyl-CoA epimerase [Halobellus ruber]MBB6645976.1 methylmalonyl-CoA epimerase [Halobellus ruber]
MSFHHLGIATADGADLAATFEGLLGAPVVHEESVDGMTVRFLELDGGYFELLEPRAEGTIARYLDRHGPGIHHVALATDDVASALDRARDLGIDPVDEAPRPGAWGHEVAFLHPDSTGGVLVEFVAAGGHGSNRTV